MARRDIDLLRVVGRRLAEVRLEHGLTQQALADRMNRQQPYVAKLELAEHRMDVADLAAIAAALVMPVSELADRLLSLKPE